MLKKILVFSMFLACCYCAEVDVTEESRAKKSKKKLIRLITMGLIFLFSKVAIFKVATFLFFMAFFQKLFALGGVLLTYMMRNQGGAASLTQPASTYGAPAEYNTVGYSYGPPDHEPVNEPLSLAEFGGNLGGFGGSLGGFGGNLGGAFNWLSGKQ